MFISCPKCQAKVEIEMRRLDLDLTMTCSKCRSLLKMNVSVDLIPERARTSTPSVPGMMDEEISQPVDPNKILIAVDGEGTLDVIKELLAEARYETLEVSAGKEVFSLLKRRRPAVALIDAGLPDIPGSQLCDEIKKDPQLKETVVILVASSDEKSGRYRREPASLFGAEDYIERRQIQKDLLLKIKKHTLGKQPSGARESVGSAREKVLPATSNEKIPLPEEIDHPDDVIDWKSISDPAPAFKAASPHAPEPITPKAFKEREDAKRLARIIVSDIVLYNTKKVDEGIRKGSFFELLKDEIEEGRRHYHSRVSAEIQKTGDYYRDALEDFIKKRKETL